MTSHRARLEECISGGLPDRPPVALWRHFPVDDQDPGRLATATAAFQRSFDLDFIKVTPASSFCLLDWGARDVWNGAVEGTREYSAQRVISEPEDWGRLPILEVYHDHDGDWQFLCGTTNDTADGRLICMGCVYERFPDMGTFADLAPGLGSTTSFTPCMVAYCSLAVAWTPRSPASSRGGRLNTRR